MPHKPVIREIETTTKVRMVCISTSERYKRLHIHRTTTASTAASLTGHHYPSAHVNTQPRKPWLARLVNTHSTCYYSENIPADWHQRGGMEMLFVSCLTSMAWKAPSIIQSAVRHRWSEQVFSCWEQPYSIIVTKWPTAGRNKCMFLKDTSDYEKRYSLDVLSVEDRGQDDQLQIYEDYKENSVR